MFSSTFPPVPEWVPAAEGFWGPPTADGLGWSPDEVRRAWLAAALLAPTVRAFAAACARRALPVYEDGCGYGSYDLPRRAVEAAERYAFGLVAEDESAGAADDALGAWSEEYDRSDDGAPTAVSEAARAASAAAGSGDSAAAAAEAAERAACAARWAADKTAFDRAYSGHHHAGYDEPSRRARDALAAANAAYGPAKAAGSAAGNAALDGERLTQARLLWLAVPPAGGPLTTAARALAAAWLDAWFRLGEDDRGCRGALADALEEGGHLPDCPRLRALREMDDWHPGLWPMSPGP